MMIQSQLLHPVHFATRCKILMWLGNLKRPDNYTISLFMGLVVASIILFAVSAKAQPAEDPAMLVNLVADGQSVPLSDNVRKELGDQADKIVRRCGYDGGDQKQQIWCDSLAQPSSIRLVYATPIQINLPRRRILVSEAMFLLKDENFLSQPILYHDGRVTLVFKCDGLQMLVLMCMPEMKALFPPAYQRSCEVVRRQRD